MHVILGFAEARWSKLGKGFLWLNFDAFPIPLNVVQTETTCIYRLYLSSWNWELIVYPIEQELPFYIMSQVATKLQVDENVLMGLFFICSISWKC